MKSFFLLVAISIFNLGIKAQTPIKLSNDQFQFTEGPVWDGIGNIYFTDIPASQVIKYSVTNDSFSIAFEQSNRANGLMFNEDYKLTVCEGGSGSITLRETDGTIFETLVNTFNNSRFNGPNDLCYDAKCGFYFTDPSFESSSQTSTGVYYRSHEGKIIKLDDFGITNPNGIIISEDGAKLYVNNTSIKEIYVYDIDSETASISNKKVFAELPDFIPISEADGMALDNLGNLYVTAKNKLHIFDGAQLSPIKSIVFPEKITNCTFGGKNKSSLYVTAVKNLYRLDFPTVRGIHHPFDLTER